MIDFRYHLVSLISVFLALAVGIVLGAGPLKETIGDSLTGQVQQLRQEKEQLRSETETQLQQLKAADAFVDQSGAQLLAGRLQDRKVAVLILGAVPADVRKAVDTRLAQAGAGVTAHLTVTDAWSDANQRSYRQALAGNLLAYLDPKAAADASVADQLAAALVQAVTAADPATPGKPSSTAAVLLELLTTGDTPLVTSAATVSTAADSVVVIAPPMDTVGKSAPTPPSDDVQATRLAVIKAAQARSAGAVLLDGTGATGSMVDAVMADDTLKAQLSTISGMSTVQAQVALPLALAARIEGQVGHFGSGAGETAVPPAASAPATPAASAGTGG